MLKLCMFLLVLIGIIGCSSEIGKSSEQPKPYQSVMKFNKYRDELVSIELSIQQIWSKSQKDEGARCSKNVSKITSYESDSEMDSYNIWLQKSDEKIRFIEIKKMKIHLLESLELTSIT